MCGEWFAPALFSQFVNKHELNLAKPNSEGSHLSGIAITTGRPESLHLFCLRADQKPLKRQGVGQRVPGQHVKSDVK
jgi:hypothetical protein